MHSGPQMSNTFQLQRWHSKAQQSTATNPFGLEGEAQEIVATKALNWHDDQQSAECWSHHWLRKGSEQSVNSWWNDYIEHPCMFQRKIIHPKKRPNHPFEKKYNSPTIDHPPYFHVCLSDASGFFTLHYLMHVVIFRPRCQCTEQWRR